MIIPISSRAARARLAQPLGLFAAFLAFGAAFVLNAPNANAQSGTPSVTIDNSSIEEGSSTDDTTMTFVGHLSFPLDYDTEVVIYTDGSTASSDVDYVSGPHYVTIYAGETDFEFDVSIIGDDTPEDDETFSVYAYSTYYDVDIYDSNATGTILNDDVATTNAAPVNVALSPSSLSSQGGLLRNFTSTQSDADGVYDIEGSQLLISTNGQIKGSIWAYFDAYADKFYLRNENNTAWLGGYSVGSSNVISTRFGSLDCSRSKVTRKGKSLIISWAITPRLVVPPGQTRALRLELAVWDYDFYTPITTDRMGTWTVTSPSLVNVAGYMTSTSSFINANNTLNIEVQNSVGVGKEKITFIVNTRSSTAGALAGVIDVAAKTISLYDDAGRRLSAPVAIGKSGATLSNSQGTLDISRSRIKLGGQTIQASLVLKPSTAFGGNTKTIYVGSQTPTQVTPRDPLGLWTINNVRINSKEQSEAPASSAPSASES